MQQDLPQYPKNLTGKIIGDTLFLDNTDITGYYDGSFKGVVDEETYRGSYYNPISGKTLSFEWNRVTAK